MNPREMSLFNAKEQTLLVSTEPERLAELSEDELGDLLVRVRRERNKYSGLHRRQAAGSVASAGKRHAATSSNTRTLRKAENFEDALSRVSLALSRAARASANELKRERIDAARGNGTGRRGAVAAADDKPPTRHRRDAASGHVTARRKASTTAGNARRQAKRDARP